MTSYLENKRIAFIGAGSMAEAIIRGLVNREIAKPEQLYATNRSNLEQLETLHKRYGIHGSAQPAEKLAFIRNADIVVVAMKPKDVKQAFGEFREALHADQLLISVVAGLSIGTIEALVPKGMPIARTMPNTSSTIGLGATGIAFSERVTPELQETALTVFRAIGEARVVPESLINAVTGVSGSGPAYVYYFLEALIDAGIESGLDPELARDLAVQTLLGAASMVQQTGSDPAELRRKVTSPNGTTEAAIKVFDEQQLKETVKAGVRRCMERAKEIGDQISARN